MTVLAIWLHLGLGVCAHAVAEDLVLRCLDCWEDGHAGQGHAHACGEHSHPGDPGDQAPCDQDPGGHDAHCNAVPATASKAQSPTPTLSVAAWLVSVNPCVALSSAPLGVSDDLSAGALFAPLVRLRI